MKVSEISGLTNEIKMSLFELGLNTQNIVIKNNDVEIKAEIVELKKKPQQNYIRYGKTAHQPRPFIQCA